MIIEYLDMKSGSSVDDSLMQQLTRLTAQGFMQPISTRLKHDVKRHVLGCDALFLLRNSEVSAYAAVSNRQHSSVGAVCHVEGIIVDPDLRGTKTGKTLLLEILRQSPGFTLAFHTQSRVMEELGKSIVESDTALALLVAQLIGTKNLVELPSEPIDQGRYGTCLYGDKLLFDQIAIVRDGFNPYRGDAIVFAGRI